MNARFKRNVMFKIAGLVLAIICLLHSQNARADLIYDVNGKTHVGKNAIEEPDRIILETELGKIIFPRDSVVFVQHGESPLETYRSFLKDISPSDAQGHFRLSIWCRENGFNNLTLLQLEKTLKADPDHKLARSALGYSFQGGQWVKGKAGGLNDEDLNPKRAVQKNPAKPAVLTRRALRYIRTNENEQLIPDDPILDWEKAHTRNTDHYLVKTNFNQKLLDEACHLMEALNKEFKYRFRIQGATQKFRVFIFATRDEYRAYARKNAPGAVEYGGYCSSRGEIVTYYPFEAKKQAHSYVLKVLRHEATHQFVNAATQNKCPLWMNEGLATFFEICRLSGGSLINLRKPNKRWLWTLKKLFEDDNVDFRALVNKVRGMYQREEYAQAWGLTYYLIISRPAAFNRYFEAIRKGQNPITTFEKIMGNDYDKLEKDIKLFINRLNINKAIE